MNLKRNYGKLYAQLHQDKPKYFSGKFNQDQVGEIVQLVKFADPDRILDYGSGKGYQYLNRRIHDQWGGMLPYCYDPGVIQISKRPEGTFAGIICTDVLEHIDPDDVETILADIFGFLHPAGRPVFAYFHISTRPAGKTFKDTNENIHLTVRPPKWWDAKLASFARADLAIRATYGD